LPGTTSLKERIENNHSDTVAHLALKPTILYKSENYFELLNPVLGTSINTTYARSYNDGPVWKGKGLTTEIHAGFQVKQGYFRFTFFPLLYFSQNASFDLPSVNPNQNPFNYQFNTSRSVDFVQRFGNKPYLSLHPGQSEIALSFDKIEFSLSTQNFTLGPSNINHILMSNSGVGFPHFKLGTPGKVDILKNKDIGKLEANLFYGLLGESQYFDEDSDNDLRYINGMAIAYEIPFNSGLSIGFQRAMYKSTEHFSGQDLYSMFYISDDGLIISDQGDTLTDTNDLFDQLASAFIEWNVPKNDLKLYFEFARNDFNGSLRRIITEFEHSRAYSLGISKTITTAKKKINVLYEHTFLPRYMSYQYRPNPPFYQHHILDQGYTNYGQLLGAGIGPGSVSDFVEVNWYDTKKLIGINLQRVRFNEDYFIIRIPNDIDKIDKHDIEFSLGMNYLQDFRKIDVGGNLTLSYRYNMYYIPKNDKINLYGNIFVRYHI
ncbi:MAG: hypothetical protein KI791_23435, partial [Cyclobacteriaceae bacterium]|nr:hypothetical protein [Cyclobacteriaceae bacterium SS2]